jgi:hypothetical protein
MRVISFNMNKVTKHGIQGLQSVHPGFFEIGSSVTSLVKLLWHRRATEDKLPMLVDLWCKLCLRIVFGDRSKVVKDLVDLSAQLIVVY